MTFKCSDTEKLKIKALANDADLPVSSYCLNRILRRRTGIREKHDREIITQAVKIVTALNALDERLEENGIKYATNDIRREVETLWDTCKL